MPLMNETADILGYYDKSIRPQDPAEYPEEFEGVR